MLVLNSASRYVARVLARVPVVLRRRIWGSRRTWQPFAWCENCILTADRTWGVRWYRIPVFYAAQFFESGSLDADASHGSLCVDEEPRHGWMRTPQFR